MKNSISRLSGYDTLIRALCLLAAPVLAEFPFFFVYMLRTGKAASGVVAASLLGGGLFSVECCSALVALGLCVLRGYVACLVMHRFGGRWLKAAVYVLFFSAMAVDVFLVHTFGLHLSPTVLTLVAETNRREAADFLTTFVLSSFPLAVVVKVGGCVLLAVGLEWLHKRYGRCVSVGIRAAVGVLLLPCLMTGAWGARIYADLLRLRSTDDLMFWEDECPCALSDDGTRLLESVWGVHLAAREMKDAVGATLKAVDAPGGGAGGTNVVGGHVRCGEGTASPMEDSVNVVLVIGESFIKWHSSLYGYTLPTSPCMERERAAGNLWAFSKAFTPYNVTSKVMRNMLYCNSLAAGERWSSTPYFPALLKKAGYEVLWWDNQKDMNSGETFAFALNSMLYCRDIARVAYTQTNARSFAYDGQLVDDFVRRARPSGHRRFVAFHLVGQHFMAEARFPHVGRFERFKAGDIKSGRPWLDVGKRRLIADYDNATLYNDYVLGRLFSLFRSTPTALVYLSDHGEEVYDYRDSMGRVNGGLTPEHVSYQYEIPMVVWLSPSFRRLRPDIVRLVSSATARRFTSDNLCHLLFRLAGVATPYYVSSRDVLSPSYEEPPLVFEGRKWENGDGGIRRKVK